MAIGTDIPYQHYIAADLQTNNFDFSYRTGLLVPPYSNTILKIIEGLGAEQRYTQLLEVTYDFGWMNSLGAYYKFDKQKKWYVGGELRLDYMTAAETPSELIESLTGIQLGFIENILTQNIEIKLGVKLFGVGARLGRSFSISSNNKHHIKTEVSISKYLITTPFLSINEQGLGIIDQAIDRLLWEEVFKEHGIIMGIGFAYSYTF